MLVRWGSAPKSQPKLVVSTTNDLLVYRQSTAVKPWQCLAARRYGNAVSTRVARGFITLSRPVPSVLVVRRVFTSVPSLGRARRKRRPAAQRRRRCQHDPARHGVKTEAAFSNTPAKQEHSSSPRNSIPLFTHRTASDERANHAGGAGRARTPYGPRSPTSPSAPSAPPSPRSSGTTAPAASGRPYPPPGSSSADTRTQDGKPGTGKRGRAGR